MASHRALAHRHSPRRLIGTLSYLAGPLALIALAANAPWMVAVPSAETNTIRIVPQDTSLNINNTNYSTLATLLTYTWPDNKVANAIVMKFDLSALPAGAIVEEATLHLALVESDTKPESTYNVAAHKLLGKNPVVTKATGYSTDGVTAWTPNTCCNNGVPMAQADVSPAYDTRAIDKVSGDKAWTMTAMVQEWMLNPATNFGLLLNSDASKLRDRYRTFASMEHPNTTLRPYLEVRYSAPDATPPSVTITQPITGANASGVVTVTAAATDNVGVTALQIKLNGAPLGPEVASPLHTVNWDTTTASDGLQVLTAVAWDWAGNSTMSAPVSVTVGNGSLWMSPQDTFLNIDATNYSTHSTIPVYTWPDHKAANAIIMKFDLSAVPAGAVVNEATLHLALLESDTSADNTYTVTAHKVLGKNPVIAQATGYTADGVTAWTPNMCCNNGVPLAQADISPAYDARTIDKALGDKTWTITAMVQEWLLNPATDFGILLNSDASKLRDRYRVFASMEHTDAQLRPVLHVTYLPDTPDVTAPVVAVTAPAAGATVLGTTSVTADATDNVGVVGVQFRLDGVSLGAEDTAAPYSVSWNTTTVGNGSHSVTAVARDARDNVTTSSGIAVTVANDTTPPSISAVASGSITVSGATITWTTNEASDSQVEYGLTLAYGSLTSVNSNLVTSHAVTLGSLVGNTLYHFRVRSRDAAGNLGTSADTTFTTLDGTPPVVAISAPAAGATVSGTASVAADATDNVGVAGVQFKLDGASLGAEDTTAPYSVSWNTTTATNAAHTLTAVGRDAAGNQTTSTAVTVSVSNPPPPPPTTWANEPSGFTVIEDTGWESGTLGNWYRIFTSGDKPITVGTVVNSPIGESKALQIDYAPGHVGGGGTELRYDIAPVNQRNEIYVGYYVQVNSLWQGHSSGINKMIYLHDGGGGFSAMWYEMFGSGSSPLDLYVVNQSGSGPAGFHENVNQVTFARDQWHKVEIYQKQGASNNGIVRVWVNGVLAIDRSDVDTRSTPIDNVTISGIWGGVGDSKNQADYMRFDRIRISRP